MVQVHGAVVEDDIPASVDSPVVVDSPLVASDVSVVWADVDVVFALHLHGAAVDVVDDEPVQVDVNFVEVEVEVTVVALHLPASEELERFIFNKKKYNSLFLKNMYVYSTIDTLVHRFFGTATKRSITQRLCHLT